MRPRLSKVEKELTAAFRKWMGNPTSPYALRSLVEHMIERELEARLKNLIRPSPDAPAT